MNIRFVIYKEIAKPIYELDRRMQQKSDFRYSFLDSRYSMQGDIWDRTSNRHR